MKNDLGFPNDISDAKVVFDNLVTDPSFHSLQFNSIFMTFNKMESVTFSLAGYQTGRNDFFVHTKELEVIKGINRIKVLDDVSYFLTSPDSSIVIGSNSKSNSTKIIRDDSSVDIILLKKYCIAFNEKYQFLILADRMTIESMGQLYVYELKHRNLIALEYPPMYNLPVNLVTNTYPDHIVFYSGKGHFNSANILLILDLKTLEVLDLKTVFDELTSHTDRAGSKVNPICIVDGSIYLGFTDHKHPYVPYSILKVDLGSKQIKNYLDKTVFNATQSPDGNWDFAFFPSRFVYDPSSRNLITLSNQTCYTYNLDNEIAEFHSLTSSLGKDGLNASGNITLYKGHLYFPCAGPRDRKTNLIRWFLVAYNLNTHEVDWRYDFPASYTSNFLSPPKVNDKYLLCHGSNNALHIFKNVNA